MRLETSANKVRDVCRARYGLVHCDVHDLEGSWSPKRRLSGKFGAQKIVHLCRGKHFSELRNTSSHGSVCVCAWLTGLVSDAGASPGICLFCQTHGCSELAWKCECMLVALASWRCF